jgi:serine/threonine protein kinase
MPRDPEQPNSVESDLFALGSILYELMAGKPPYHDKLDIEIESLYKQEEFPCIESILCGELILRCWRREFKPVDEMLAAFNDYVSLRREHLFRESATWFNFALDWVEGRHTMLGKISVQAPRLKL